MRYEGSKSWLISVSPYFFPTFSVLLVITLSLVPDDKLFLTCAVLGGSISYHLISNIKQLHTAQTDLIEVGLPFVILFLPTANLLLLFWRTSVRIRRALPSYRVTPSNKGNYAAHCSRYAPEN